MTWDEGGRRGQSVFDVRGERVVVVLCGANTDPSDLASDPLVVRVAEQRPGLRLPVPGGNSTRPLS
jgi:hypothetical protein